MTRNTRCVVWLAGVFATTALAGEPAGRVIFSDGFERDLNLKTQIHGANQPYTRHAIGISTDRARSGTHSVKVDVTYRHGFNVYVAPRSNATPQVLWGRLHGPGTFVLPGLDLPIRPGKGYLFSCYVWVERVTTHNPLFIEVQTATRTDYGPVRSSGRSEGFSAPTNRWVKVEKELGAWLVERLDAQGYRARELTINAIMVSSFARVQDRLTVYVDDVTIREVPAAVADAYNKRRAHADSTTRPTFRSYPNVENVFAWGVYANLVAPGRGWFTPYDWSQGVGHVRRQQIERVRDAADWILLDWRRHYGNINMQGGGMLFPGADDAAYDYVAFSLDRHNAYGVQLVPSTYMTQHYASDKPRKVCEQTMRKAVARFKDHPAMLGYLLVDEPQSADARDFYWGKGFIESLDRDNPCFCLCNGIQAVYEFARTMQVCAIDYYPLGPVPGARPGAWAQGDLVRLARTQGARRIWVLPPCFGASSWRPPSPAEFKIQIFSALAEGATGFMVYSYADQPAWSRARTEYGRLVDPFGNPTPNWQVFRELGPYLRSAGPLLIGAQRLPNDAVHAQVAQVVVSDVGRRRPWVVARAFADPKRDARYLVVSNNSRFHRRATTVTVRQLRKGDQVLDLFSLQDVPRHGAGFRVTLGPGDGRLFAVGAPTVLARVRHDVFARRYAIERDLLALETRLAGRMGTDVAAVQSGLKQADEAAGRGEFVAALQKLGEARFILDRRNRANTDYWRTHDAVEHTRRVLGRINTIITPHVRVTGSDRNPLAPRLDGPAKPIAVQTIGLADRFYTLQSKLLRQGPTGLAGDAEQLLKDAAHTEAAARARFGR